MLVITERFDDVVRLTLNAPNAYNALSRDMIAALQEALDESGADQGLRCMIIRGAGPGFCAGHDLSEVRGNRDIGFYDALLADCSRLMTSVVRSRLPVIAEIHGVAAAAGCQLVASCDLAIADSAARFTTPGVNIGLFCSTPMVALSRAVPRKAAMEMLLTGDLIDANEAVRIGLINRHVESSALEEETLALARKIASKSSTTVAIGKEAFYRQDEMDLDDAYAYASRVMAHNMMQTDADEGISAFLEKREPVWKDR